MSRSIVRPHRGVSRLLLMVARKYVFTFIIMNKTFSLLILVMKRETHTATKSRWGVEKFKKITEKIKFCMFFWRSHFVFCEEGG